MLLSLKGFCSRPTAKLLLSPLDNHSKGGEIFLTSLFVQPKAGIKTMVMAKHNFLMSHLEHRWTGVCLFFYRNLKSKNV